MKTVDFIHKYPMACTGTKRWLRRLGPTATMAEAWLACHRADYMLWALGRVGYCSFPGPRHFAIDCTIRALERERQQGHEPKRRVWTALRMARKYLSGEATRAQMLNASNGAWDVWIADAPWSGARGILSAVRAAAWVASSTRAISACYAATANAVNVRAERAWQADRLRYYVPVWPK